MTAVEAGPRKRDPQRRQSILNAAAALLAKRGYGSVSMAEIGAEVGIRASAIYWHFPSKQALLVALFDESLDTLLADEQESVARLGTTRAALQEIVRLQVDFVVDQRTFARVYYREAGSLPDEDLLRLRRKQRQYVEIFAHLLRDLSPAIGEPEAMARVHAAIGAIQSALVYTSPLPVDQRKELLTDAAFGVLGDWLRDADTN